MNLSKGKWALQQLYIQMQGFSKIIGLVASLHQVTGYSSGVNGKKFKLRRKRSLGFVAAKKPFTAVKRFSTAKVVARRDEKELG